ncbi:MAG: TlpA family protein disulfide reductase [Chloroflexi bacterium]|nr:TlpA family protein disulfide reductase [Chloroflexota bacterium]
MIVLSSSHWRVFTFLLLMLGASWVGFSRVPTPMLDADRIPAPRENFPAPDFTLTTFDGESKTLSSQRGRVVIVNLWASWCGPCRAEMPALKKVYEANRHRGLEVFAVNSTFQDDERDARLFARDLNLSFTLLLDPDGAVSRRYLLRALPSTFFIDKRGVIRTVIVGGPMSEATLQTQVESLLADGK